MNYLRYVIHHTENFVLGFMGLCNGQLKSSAKSGLFITGPFRRNSPGECGSVLRYSINASFLNFSHVNCP